MLAASRALELIYFSVCVQNGSRSIVRWIFSQTVHAFSNCRDHPRAKVPIPASHWDPPPLLPLEKCCTVPEPWALSLTHMVMGNFDIRVMCNVICAMCSVVANSLRPHGLQPTRLLCPWDSAGKNSGVGCHVVSFPTQGLNLSLLHLLHWQVNSSPLGKPGATLEGVIKSIVSVLADYELFSVTHFKQRFVVKLNEQVSKQCRLWTLFVWEKAYPHTHTRGGHSFCGSIAVELEKFRVSYQSQDYEIHIKYVQSLGIKSKYSKSLKTFKNCQDSKNLKSRGLKKCSSMTVLWRGPFLLLTRNRHHPGSTWLLVPDHHIVSLRYTLKKKKKSFKKV